MPYYLSIKAVNFDYSVYDTHDISTIRGGSFSILQAFRSLEASYANNSDVQVLSTAGSEALLRLDTDDADTAERIAEECLALVGRDTRKFATFVSALLPDGGLKFSDAL